MFSFRNMFKKGCDTLNYTAIKKAIGTDVSCSREMEKAIFLWGEMYKNKAPWINKSTKSLNLAASISSEVARLATIEMTAKITGSKRAEVLSEAMNLVMRDLRRYVEYACAKGALVFKPYVKNNRIFVDFIQADSFYPVRFDESGRILSAVFVEKYQSENRFFSRLEYHSLQGDRYTIKNMAFCSHSSSELGRGVSLDSVPQWSQMQSETIISGVLCPLFAYFKIPQANTIDTYSPLGVSVYAKAVELIEEADKQYSRLLWEFESGERALYLDDSAFRRDKHGNPILPDKRLYRSIDSGVDNLFQDWTPTLREQNILNGLDAILTKVEDTCSLARGTFSNVQTSAKTATELKILRQRSYAMVSDVQKSLESALMDLLLAMDVWCSLYKLAPRGRYVVNFDFDDSIMLDRTTMFNEKIQLLESGVISKEEFRNWYFGEQI